MDRSWLAALLRGETPEMAETRGRTQDVLSSVMPQTFQQRPQARQGGDPYETRQTQARARNDFGIPQHTGSFGEWIGNVGRGVGMVANPMIGIPAMAAQGMMGRGVSGGQAPMGLFELGGRAARQAVDPYTGLPTGGGGNNDRDNGSRNLGRTGYTSGQVESKTGRMVGGV